MIDDEKILKFAGFTLSPRIPPHVTAPDGEELDNRPDTADLTWLFKWCVPKLNELAREDGWSSDWTPWLEKQWGVEIPFGKRTSKEFRADSFGEALRAAILSLAKENIDKNG